MMTKRLVITLGICLAVGISAMAQTATTPKYATQNGPRTTLTPGEGNYLEEGGYLFQIHNDQTPYKANLFADLVRIDKKGGDGVSFITKGGKMPYFVAPSFVYNADWDPESGVVAPKNFAGDAINFTASKCTFTFTEVDGPASSTAPAATKLDLSAVTDHANAQYIQVKDDADVTSRDVYVKVVEASTAEAFKGCKPSDGRVAHLVIVDQPKVGFAVESGVDGLTSTSSKYVVKGAAAATLDGKKCIKILTCDKAKIDGKEVLLKIKAEEEGLTNDAAREYVYKMKRYAFKVDKDGNVQDLGTAEDVTLANQSANGISFKASSSMIDNGKATLPTFSPGAEDKSYDVVYQLVGNETIAGNYDQKDNMAGVISATSYRSFLVNTDDLTKNEKVKSFPFDVPLLVISLVQKPETGPVYHIPNDLGF